MIDNKGDNSESTDLLTRLLIRQAFSMNEAVPPVAVKRVVPSGKHRYVRILLFFVSAERRVLHTNS